MNRSNRTIFTVSCLLCVIVIWHLTDRHVHQPATAVHSEIFVGNDSFERCHWKFDHYVASDWEKYWYDNINTLQENVCATLSKADQLNKSIRLLQRIGSLRRSTFSRLSTSNDADELFSQMFYRMECSSGRSSLVAQQIEPLIGLLRDPLTICPSFNETTPSTLVLSEDDAMQSKRFLLLALSAPYFNFTTAAPIAPWIYQKHGRKFLFDIGSSYFNGGKELDQVGSAISARWFYEYFRNCSLHFDRIIAFERGDLSPSAAWEQLPEDVLPIYTLINVAAEPTGKINPLKLLQSLTKPDDYVLFKLDIDVFELEIQFIQQIVENQIFHSLIDELFFEMHVSIKEMASFWQFTAGPAQLNDTYVLFTKLRQLGIRMHSWP